MSGDPPPPRRRGPPIPLRARIFAASVAGLHSVSLRRDGSINRTLLSIFDRPVPANPNPVAGVSTSDHSVSASLRVRLFTPAATADGARDRLPVILYFHGGGFAFHTAASGPYDALCRLLAARVPAIVASVNYRLTPEHRYPAQYDDGSEALKWILEGASGALPSPPAAVFIAGDSAGGNIAHHVARRSMSELHKSIAGLVAIQPFFGGETPTESEERLRESPFGSRQRSAWLWRAFLPEGATRDHEAANVFGPGSGWCGSGLEDWNGFPPPMVCIGGWDPLQDRQRAYVDGLRGAGVDVHVVEYPDAIHAFYLFEELPDREKMIGDVAEFVNRRMDWPKEDNSSEV